jgi:oligoendopeptidase F
MIKKESLHLAENMNWNLEEFYHGPEDPNLDHDLEGARDKAFEFATSYRGKLNQKDLDPQILLSALREYESIHEIGMKPCLFAYLYHSSRMQDPLRNRLLQKVGERWNEISQLITFFSLDIITLPENFLRELAGHRDLLNYRNFLHHLVQRKPHVLSEPVERIIKRKNLTGRKAFLSLYDELMGSLSFPLDIKGKREALNINQVLAIRYSHDRSLREKAFLAFHKELGRHGMLFKNILNTLIQDYHQENVIRGHPSPMSRMHLSSEVEGSIITVMMDAVQEHYPLAKKYFCLKARILGLEHLKNTDIFAPLEKKAIKVGFSDARQLILDAMEGLHPLFHSITYDFFRMKWIDAEVRAGKQDGAFCKCLTPTQHPFISMSYTGDVRDLLILGHELGHAIHYTLSSKQSYLNFSPSPILAETAAAFIENILIRHLMEEKPQEIAPPYLFAKQAEQILTSVFRQDVLTRFEEKIHRLREDHLLSEEEICRLWSDENHRLYGEEVKMVPGYRWGWTYIPHFFHCPFYCYSYIFGNLVSIVLFQNFMHSQKGFLDKIIYLFSSGSSKPPIDMLAEIGLNPEKKPFWAEAFRYFDALIDSLKIAHPCPKDK